MANSSLHMRERYLADALMFRDTDLIKVITGVRRCGKTSLLELVRRQIESEHVEGRGIVSINLEGRACPVKTEEELYGYVRGGLSSAGTTYVFIDEPQRLRGWQDAVNAMRVDFDCDIYLTGSNAYLLSSELSTYLSGRYVEVRMLPLSLAEYARFCGLDFTDGSSVAHGSGDEIVLFDDLLTRYLTYGGMPAIASLETTQAMHAAYLSGVYEAVVARDILHRERERGKSEITDAVLLRNVVNFLADNIGNECSANSVANALSSSGSKTTNKTVSSYLSALNEAYLFYGARRYDLHGKALLKTNPKEYIVDLGLRSYLMGYRATDSGRIFENAVYLQLLHEGYEVHVGKLYNKEVDFVAIKDGKRHYIQVTEAMDDERVQERELAPLRSIRDAFPKMVIIRRGANVTDIDGVQIISARNFFISS